MKNVQVIDGAVNSIFEVYEISDEQFAFIFPGNTDVSFADEVDRKLTQDSHISFWDTFYSKRVLKTEVSGIHGTLHLTGSVCLKEFFPTRRESEVVRE